MFFDLFHRCHEKETNRYWVILDKMFYIEFTSPQINRFWNKKQG